MTTPRDNSNSPTGGGRFIRHGPPPVVPDHTLLRVIGQGSYGEVWLARNIMGTYRAVKVVYRSTFPEDGPYEREFEGIRKFETVSLSHGSQVHILHISRNDQAGYFYYVMELADDAAGRSAEGGADSPKSKVQSPKSVEGGERTKAGEKGESGIKPGTYVPWTLQHELEKRGRLPFAECLKISHDLADAVKHLHDNGLVHRDIKPANIIFVNGVPKLADIGLVTDLDATLTFGSTQGYIAPEGAGRPQGDIYSLGKVTYEMWSGQDRQKFPEMPPGWAEWPDREQVSELREVSNRACENDTAKRYATADDLIKDLDLLKAGKSVRQMRMLERGWRWALAAAIAALVVGLVAVTGFWLFSRVRQRELVLREAEMLRVREPTHGWSTNALAKLKRAGGIHLADDVRAQAAVTLAGLDTQVVRELTNYGADYLVFDGEGRRLLMDGGEGGQQARLWDTWTGELSHFNVSGRGPVWFGEDGRARMLHAAEPGVYEVTSLEDSTRVARLEFKPSLSNSEPNAILAVSPAGSLAAAAVESVTNTAERLEVRTSHLAVWRIGKAAVLWQGLEPCTALAFSPDDKYLAIGKSDGVVQVRSLPEWRLTAAFTNEHAAITSLIFGPDPHPPLDRATGQPGLLVAGTSGGTIWIHRLSPASIQAVCRGAAYEVLSLAFAPDGMTLICAGRDRPVLWDVATGRLLLRSQPSDFATALVSSPDGRRCGVGMRKGFFKTGRVKVIELQPDRGIKSMRGLSSQAGKAAFSHDGEHLAVLALNWEVGIWNLASNRLEHLIGVPQGSTADNAGLAFSRDDKLFAFATSGGATLRDVRTGVELKRWELPSGLQEHLWFNSSGHLFLLQWEWPVAGKPGEGVVRDLSRTNFLAQLYPPLRLFDGRIFHSCLSSDGQVLAVCGARGIDPDSHPVFKVLSPETGQLLCPLLPTEVRKGATFFLDASGRMLGLSSASGRTDFYEIPSGRLIGHSDGLPAATSPGGEWLAHHLAPWEVLGGFSIWRGDNPKRSVVIGAGLKGPAVPQFSPDGRSIAWGTTDGTVLVAEMADVFQRLEQLGLGWR
jgi:WD40 repeat protein